MSNGPFGFDPEDLDRLAREATEGLRDAFGQAMKGMGGGSNFGSMFTDQRKRPAPEPETTGDTGDGVWAIYTVGDAGAAHIDQVFATELDALRAHKDNVDPMRRVRFLPYGVTVSVLDGGDILDADDTTDGEVPPA